MSCRSQWPRGLRRRSATARLLRLWVHIPQGAWMSDCCECFVLSRIGLCDELIARPEESYRLWCVVVCDIETSRMRRPWPAGGCRAKTNKKPFILGVYEIKFTLVPWNRVAFWKYRTLCWSLVTTSLLHCWRSCAVFSLTSSFKSLIHLDVEYTPHCSDRNRSETGVEVTK